MSDRFGNSPRLPWPLVLLLAITAFVVGATVGAISLNGFTAPAQALGITSAILIAASAFCAKDPSGG